MPKVALHSTILALVLLVFVGHGQERTLEHAAGTTVLDGPAERVVALEWTYAEVLAAIGVAPVGVADVGGYESWVGDPALGDDVTDVGTRQEPSLEAILALDPDLIVGVDFRHAPILDELEAIAPTVSFAPYPGEDGPTQLGRMRAQARTLGHAVGREAEAEALLSETDTAFEEARTRLAEAGREGDAVLLAQAFTTQGNPQIRMFTDNAMAVAVLERLGLRNAWPSSFAQYGFDTIDVEGLVPVSDADALLYVTQADDDVFGEALADDPIWSNLGFVEAGEAHALGGDTWLFGGPRSNAKVAQRVADLLTE